MTDHDRPRRGPFAVAGVRVRYGDHVALLDATVEFTPGTVTALVGPNGAGKSTLLNVLAGVVRPDVGTVTTVRRPAYVLQRSAIPESMPLSVREAVAMGVWAHRSMVRPLGPGGRAVVAECMERLAISDLVRRQVTELSGGQRQRVLVAQALAQQSELLLLDEPYVGLDAVARGLIADSVVAETARGATVVMSTHDLADAAVADQVVLLVDGEQRAVGGPVDVLRPEILATAYGQVISLGDGHEMVVLPDTGALVRHTDDGVANEAARSGHW